MGILRCRDCLPVPLPQTLRDAVIDCDDLEEMPSEEQQAAWQRLSTSFYSTSSAVATVAKPQSRLGPMQHLAAIRNMLNQMLGWGVERFLPREEEWRCKCIA
eukprot:15470550-Alexandrium_andersonii.AAC.1